MKFIIDFYKGLDTVNLLIFWGVIIVVLLLLIFAIIIANKNRKLKEILISKEIELDDTKNELAIKRNNDALKIETTKKEEEITTKEESEKEIEPLTMPILEEDKFVAEEHVMEYDEKLFSIPNMKKANEITEEKEQEKEIIPKEEIKEEVKKESKPTKEITIPTAPYQRNVLREMSLNQTSPIGIIRRDNDKEKEIVKAKELHESFENKQENTKENYLNEVSKKLAEADNINGIKRTEYELKQEEDAIISYEELMQKKDSLQMIDEEDAVISIEELIERKNKQSKLYNITNEEEDEKFIKELKNFRSDL